jgi:hypothetical protein
LILIKLPGDVVTANRGHAGGNQVLLLGDDVFEEDLTNQSLEAYVSERTGKEAGLFVLSVTMGNQLAIRYVFTQPPTLPFAITALTFSLTELEGQCC